MSRGWILLASASACLAGCGGGEPGVALAERAPGAPPAAEAAEPVCRVEQAGQPLPDEVRETSGLAQSRRDPRRFWTHNDAGSPPHLFGLDATGRLVQRVRVVGAEAADWEDLEAAPCDGGACLYVGDIGDNDAERERITVYRIPEPGAGAAESAPAAALHARFPDGPQDAEALFVLPSGEWFVVTKGRRGPVVLYRYPAPQRPGETVTLERVRELFPAPRSDVDRVTGAGASRDGRWVGIRTYRSLYLYRASELVGGAQAEPAVVDLAPLGEGQGEALAFAADRTVWLSSEAENQQARPRWSRLRCVLPGG